MNDYLVQVYPANWNMPEHGMLENMQECGPQGFKLPIPGLNGDGLQAKNNNKCENDAVKIKIKCLDYFCVAFL